ncbi:MAG TPA: O-antigen ligase family protein [Gaiellaceae bacterium]|nr:O-antigen ligase family protein [Gaiellaceae bacterium]
MTDLARLAGPIACAGLAVLLVSRTRRNRIAGFGYCAVGTALLVASLAHGSAAELAGAIVGGVVLAPLLARLFRREPWLVAYGTLAFLPLRVGYLGHELLVPLYAVSLGAAVLLLWQLVDGDERSRELGLFTWPLALFVGWTGLSLGWTVDVRAGAVEVLAFYIPLTILALSIARLPWNALRLRLLYVELVLMALLFACVGLYQYATRTIFENGKLKVDNAYTAIFRVNSLFWDPSIYGRFLVVALIPTVVLIVRGRSLRAGVAAAVFAVVAWFGLLFSFSQSSFAALLVGVIGVAAVAWRWKAALAVAAAVVVLAGIAFGQPSIRHALLHHTKAGLNSASSGRYSLVSNGLRIAKAHPAVGVGVGGFSKAYSKRTHRSPRKSASHDTPVTVAAEGGAVGELLYLWLLVAVFAAAARRVDRSLYGNVALAAGLAVGAIFVHSLFYNDFFEDPTTWGLLGLIALTAPRRVRAKEAAPAVEKKEPVVV